MPNNKAQNKKLKNGRLSDRPNAKLITDWLLICCSAIFITVIIGALTRLTDSGLSIVRWEPLTGAIPPLSETQWNEYFQAYQQIPEYEKINKGMNLAEFKGIFWLEYLHRLMGRLVGLIFLIPYVYFLSTKQLTAKTALKLGAIFVLGVLQGFIGWYMVKSGLAERSDVSQYRLALHLGVAFLIYAILYWTALDIKCRVTNRWENSSLGGFSFLVTVMIFIMALLGALMAGTDAGFTYNTFPLMDGKLLPNKLYILEPWWRNHFENITMIQFQHRYFGMILAVAIFGLGYSMVKKDFDNIILAIALVFITLTQIALGVITLHSFASYADYDPATFAYRKILYMPVIIAALHQANALVLFTISLRTSHKLLKENVFGRTSYVKC